jgi:hypothetical protein
MWRQISHFGDLALWGFVVCIHSCPISVYLSLLSTNEGYQQHGREVADRNPNSPTISQKSTPSRMKHRTSGIEMRKTSVGSSNDGGDKDPPRKSLEKSHIVYTFVKRKRNTQTTGLSIPETQEIP